MKNLIIDLDGTLTFEEPHIPYEDKKPNLAFIKKLQLYKANGFHITIFTSRNMRTLGGDLSKIRALTLPSIYAWLNRHAVPYDEVLIGKPWCGLDGFYVDDKAIRPSEFLNLDYEQICSLLQKEGQNKTHSHNLQSPPKQKDSQKSPQISNLDTKS